MRRMRRERRMRRKRRMLMLMLMLMLNRRRGTGDRGLHRTEVTPLDWGGVFCILMLQHGGIEFLHLLLGLAAVV